MGITVSEGCLKFSGSSGFEDNFKQAVSFSEGFLKKALGADLSQPRNDAQNSV